MWNAECGMSVQGSNLEKALDRDPINSAFRIPHYKSIANGFSSISFSVFRNAAPVAPSITR